MRWVLPDYIQDALPSEALRLDALRRTLLQTFHTHGYQLVMPPLLEYLDSLTTGAGQDLRLRTFKLVDQLSGRTMGIRADMTPQVTRINAHLLNRRGVSRLCYCGSVLHTLPSTLTATREPIQLGAELYGHNGIEADTEILRLMALTLQTADIPATRIDISHIGLFHALTHRAGTTAEQAERLFCRLQGKDLPELNGLVQGLPHELRDAFLSLPELYGEADILEEAAARLPDYPEIRSALDELRSLASTLADLPVSFDLSDLRGYHYHSGIMFAAYGGNSPNAVALGGRYDHVSQAFGRNQPAVGFSLDLRELARLRPTPPLTGSILAPLSHNSTLAETIQTLRQQGEVVTIALPGHEGTWHETGCDRQLITRNGQWVVEPLQENRQ